MLSKLLFQRVKLCIRQKTPPDDIFDIFLSAALKVSLVLKW